MSTHIISLRHRGSIDTYGRGNWVVLLDRFLTSMRWIWLNGVVRMWSIFISDPLILRPSWRLARHGDNKTPIGPPQSTDLPD